MRILHVSTQDITGGGGAFEATYRMHRYLRQEGHDSRMLVATKVSDDPHVLSAGSSFPYAGVHLAGKVLEKVYLRLVGQRPHYYFTLDRRAYPTRHLVKTINFNPHVIVAYWTGYFTGASQLAELHDLTGAPVAWMPLDLAPLTGGCHYTRGCNGYSSECGRCPAIGSSTEDDISRNAMKRKRNSILRANMVALSPSSWVSRKLEQSSLWKGLRVQKMFLPVDPAVFCPVDKARVRAQYGIGSNMKVVFFGAHSLNEERKGTKYLVDAFRLMRTNEFHSPVRMEDILLLSAGRERPAELTELGYQHRHVGYMRTDKELASMYQLADVFACPSTEDAGPLMINESIMCGTPVVSFDVGIAQDLVHDGKTGYRAKTMDGGELAKGIMSILSLSPSDHQRMSDDCRNLALSLYAPEVFVKNAVGIFGGLIGEAVS